MLTCCFSSSNFLLLSSSCCSLNLLTLSSLSFSLAAKSARPAATIKLEMF